MTYKSGHPIAAKTDLELFFAQAVAARFRRAGFGTALRKRAATHPTRTLACDRFVLVDIREDRHAPPDRCTSAGIAHRSIYCRGSAGQGEAAQRRFHPCG